MQKKRTSAESNSEDEADEDSQRKLVNTRQFPIVEAW